MKQISQINDSNSLRAQVFSEIEKAILDGAVKAGESLNESKLSAGWRESYPCKKL